MHKRLLRAACIFFGMLFLFMNAILMFDYGVTGNVQEVGNGIWWCAYVFFFVIAATCYSLGMTMTEQKLPDEEDQW